MAETKKDIDIRVVDVGRALEKKDLETAKSLALKLGDTPPELLVKSRLAEALHDDETAVRIYHQMTDVLPEFEKIRIKALAAALVRAGRPEESADQIEALLKTDRSISQEERFSLRMKWADQLREIHKLSESIVVLEQAKKDAKDAAKRDRASLSLARVLLEQGRKKEASAILEAATMEPTSRETLLDALSLLKEHDLSPKWSDARRMATATALMDYQAFDAAEDMLKSVVSAKEKAEAEWLGASILFNKRRHYKEALAALKPIAAGKGPHADEAKLLSARALSRLDRDEEAIKAYRSYAVKTKNNGKAAEARFLAARLEFYLGRCKQASFALERLVGKGTEKEKRLAVLDDSDMREAHFLAGLSLILAHQPVRAEPHLTAASKGTSDPEVLDRNAYWKAVAKTMAEKKGWKEALWAVCEKDPTDWYARMAAMRLEDAKQPLGPCELTAPVFKDAASSSEPAVGGVQPDETKKTAQQSARKLLREISPLVSLYAEAGLFKDAAALLRDLEKRGALRLSSDEWIAQYTSLEAPEYAISKASSRLQWPPGPNERTLAEAAYPVPYRDAVTEVESRRSLPDKLIFAIARKESLFDPEAVSRAGAMGLMQMMPQTYEANRKRAGLPPLKSGELPGPEESIRAAGYEFEALFVELKSLPLAVMAYNGGEAATSRWVERSSGLPLDVFVEKAGFLETRNYVRRVVKNLVRYRLLYGGPPLELPRTIAKNK